ncbi:WG repeat-containing protein [Sinomicrobium weinanense]|uniref:WG repeat-containing protein n=1 Tax=Sinomicrobium weinanense TaxID=2842200 RepID=A0A926JTR8_9FLAO|nr:WG repeat-containing protein [Sinomicrobium weinanense]MBC9797224.1 WG repeat-containing protein [Sinomicrobium weinanense]MBU3125563.1 WG repeat-containing protein [Sinomicrobium weinanense]
MTTQKPIIIFLLWMAAIPVQAQGLFSTYGNCSQNTYGYINIKDTAQSIAPVFCDASTFSEGLAAVKKDGKWGFIDAGNKEVIAFQFDYARSFMEGQSIVKSGDFYGVIDKKGKFAIPPCYYDLIPCELEGQRYYISRDSTFFAGIIDARGNEILPHRYTYIIPYEASLSKRRTYKNVPFFTMYREVDTTEGSFYEQFKKNPYHFSPDKGRKDIYDTAFNKITSRNVTSYEDEYTHKELTSIDNYLENHREREIHLKREGIRQLLDSKKEYESKTGNPATKDLPATDEELDQYMGRMGYEKFTGEDGKTGVKKDGSIILLPKFEIVKWWGGALFSPPKESISYLEEHYSGEFDVNVKNLFKLFCIAAGDKEKGMVYTMKGEKVLELGKNSFFEATPAGFVHQTAERDTVRQLTRYKTDLTGWKGQVIVPSAEHVIKVLNEKHILTKREKETERGKEEHSGLYNTSGEAVIPEGTFSAIEPFQEVPGFYLAGQHVIYPTVEEQKNREGKNKRFVLLKVEGSAYTIIREFTASKVYPRSLGPETGMLKYRKEKED